ncbi:MAG TPA: TMEM175 family protein [Holophagaceae bacterium]|nr:TMEM175 family protein [Holophagaceae bacterium]
MTSTPFAISRGRLDALTDGIFAIAMTILVLELHAPDLGPGAGLPAFREALAHQWPSLLGYVASFSLLGLFWYQHHWLTHGLARVDAPFFAANLLFLLMVGSFPFTLSLVLHLHSAGDGGLAVLPYLICLGFLLLALGAMALLALGRGLLDPRTPTIELKRRGLTWAATGLALMGMSTLGGRMGRALPILALPFLARLAHRRWHTRKAKASA